MKTLWNKLVHNGVYFPQAYTPLPNTVKLFYDGKPVGLTITEEELAYLYARYIGTEYTDNKTFNKNFWSDWKKILGKNSIIQNWDLIDFTQIKKFIEEQKEKKKELSSDEKKAIKEERDEKLKKYKTCFIDGIEQPVGNFMVEPPEIFKGRGKHPKSGCIKPRVKPEDVTINISKDAEVPKPNIEGSWGKVVEDKTVMWIASWKDSISGKTKYVFVGQDSNLRMSNDIKKFELARKLKTKIKKIRNIYLSDLSSPERKTRQIACAIYLIDLLALRVGNEKSEDEAETVGVTSLKVKNVHITDDHVLKLDFLGKDSIRYQRTVCIDQQVSKNMKEFKTNKNDDEDLFELVNSTDINDYLHSLMKNLSAKVFRTFNASYLFQKELNKIETKVSKLGDDISKQNLALHLYNLANTEVAKLCNHQKKVSANFKDQIKKIDDQIKKLSSKDKKTDKQREKLKELKNKKKLKQEIRNLSLGTSKINYLDPRISIAFLKKYGIPTEKVFTSSVLKKFTWALDVTPDWQF